MQEEASCICLPPSRRCASAWKCGDSFPTRFHVDGSEKRDGSSVQRHPHPTRRPRKRSQKARDEEESLGDVTCLISDCTIRRLHEIRTAPICHSDWLPGPIQSPI